MLYGALGAQLLYVTSVAAGRTYRSVFLKDENMDAVAHPELG